MPAYYAVSELTTWKIDPSFGAIVNGNSSLPTMTAINPEIKKGFPLRGVLYDRRCDLEITLGHTSLITQSIMQLGLNVHSVVMG